MNLNKLNEHYWKCVEDGIENIRARNGSETERHCVD